MSLLDNSLFLAADLLFGAKPLPTGAGLGVLGGRGWRSGPPPDEIPYGLDKVALDMIFGLAIE